MMSSVIVFGVEQTRGSKRRGRRAVVWTYEHVAVPHRHKHTKCRPSAQRCESRENIKGSYAFRSPFCAQRNDNFVQRQRPSIRHFFLSLKNPQVAESSSLLHQTRKTILLTALGLLTDKVRDRGREHFSHVHRHHRHQRVYPKQGSGQGGQRKHSRRQQTQVLAHDDDLRPSYAVQREVFAGKSSPL